MLRGTYICGVLCLAVAALTTTQAGPAIAAKGKPAQSRKPGTKAILVMSDGTLTAAAIKAVAFSAAGREDDKFDNRDRGRGFIGKKFRFYQSAADGDRSTSTVDSYWEYDKTAETMLFKVKPYTSDFYVDFESKVTGQHTGQNAFGVKVRVKSYVELEAKVRALNSEEFTGRMATVFKADPTRGKLLAKDVALMVEGVITPDSDGMVSSCSRDTSEATISEPVEVLTYTCSVNAKITHLAFVSRDSGWHFFDWPQETPTAAGH